MRTGRVDVIKQPRNTVELLLLVGFWLGQSATPGFALPPATLQIEATGTGMGTVEVEPLGLTCAPPCTVSVPAGTAVSLTGEADSGSQFWGFWGAGECTCASCTFTPDGFATVEAVFGLREGFRVTTGSPSCGETGVAGGSAVEVFFNETIASGPDLDLIELADEQGTPLPFRSVVSSSQRRLTLLPDSPLAEQRVPRHGPARGRDWISEWYWPLGPVPQPLRDPPT